jgi:hypothetical protein
LTVLREIFSPKIKEALVISNGIVLLSFERTRAIKQLSFINNSCSIGICCAEGQAPQNIHCLVIYKSVHFFIKPLLKPWVTRINSQSLYFIGWFNTTEHLYFLQAHFKNMLEIN